MKYINTIIINWFYKVFIILEIEVVLISCSLSKVASKIVENNGLTALMSPHSAPCWAVPSKEWRIQQTVKATHDKGS